MWKRFVYGRTITALNRVPRHMLNGMGLMTQRDIRDRAYLVTYGYPPVDYDGL